MDAKAIILSNGSSSHVNLSKNFAGHIPIVEKENVDEVVKKGLPWVHIIIGECRNGIAAIHKEIDGRFLQLYLNEYCWKFNRRFFRVSEDPKYDLLGLSSVLLSMAASSRFTTRPYCHSLGYKRMPVDRYFCLLLYAMRSSTTASRVGDAFLYLLYT